MMRKAAWGFVGAGLFLGLLHVGLTWPIYRSSSLEALWFAGSGLAIVCCSLLNLVALQNERLSGRWLIMVGNILVAGFFAAAWPLLPGPQAATGFAVFACLAGYFGVQLTRRDALRAS